MSWLRRQKSVTPGPTPMVSTASEAAVVHEANVKGMGRVPVIFNGAETSMCGTCGRLVCHPRCPKGGFPEFRGKP